jgi:hypothetical protein
MLTDPLVGLDGGVAGAVGVSPPVLLVDGEEPQLNVTPTQRTVSKVAANVFIDPTLIDDSAVPNLF